MKKQRFKHLFLASTVLLVASGAVYATNIETQQTSTPRNTVSADQVTTIASGVEGTAPWVLTSDGTLTIDSGRLKNYAAAMTAYRPAWDKYKDDIKKVVITGPLNFGQYNNSQYQNGEEGASYLFWGMTKVESYEGLENIDFSMVIEAPEMFYYNTNVKTLDLSSYNTRMLIEARSMFSGMSSLESLDLSSFDMRSMSEHQSTTGVFQMFLDDENLKSITLGKYFDFHPKGMGNRTAGLPEITQNSEYTGNWQDLGDGGTPEHPKGEHIFTSAELMSNYDGASMAGTFVWQPNTLYGGKDLTAQTSAIGQADATANLETQLEDPFGNMIDVTAKITDGAGQEVQNGQLEKGKYTVTYTGTTTNGQTATVTNILIVTDPGAPDVKGGDVTVHYQDTLGNTIAPDATLQGNVMAPIVPEKKAISGYTYEGADGPSMFIDTPQEITMVYSKNGEVPGEIAGDVTVHYKDESGNTISPDTILKGYVDDNISPYHKDIKDYTYKRTEGPSKFTTEQQEVSLVYSKNSVTPVVGGNVTVQYVDTAGKSISSDAILKGNVGDAIKPSQKSISGYTYKSTTWPDTTHKFTAKTQTVKMVYSKNTTPTPVTQSPISVYRLYNKKSMEHLYTKDANEYNNLPKMSKDWVREGVNFKAYAKADSTTQAVYRVYNPKSGEHLFTTDSNEVKVLTTQHGWKNEGVAWNSPKAGKEVYRLFNPKAGLGAHFVTADANERKVLTTKPNEWKYEGIAWHSVK
ncbi:MucBP domain-containing protein [Lactococcus garvieae]|uniref:MucBP domain-containing protein n=1 Tax=Lactococcus garvieae TaxID=1363 RepID=UPI0038551B08